MLDIRAMQTAAFWRAVAAEFIATFFLVFVGCGSTLPFRPDESLDIVKVSLTFGITVAGLVQLFGSVSGGHINPAVTIAMLATGNISPIKTLFYILAQCVGGICGATLLYAVTPAHARGGLGANGLLNGTSIVQGIVIEVVLTMLLVFVVFAAAVDKRNQAGGSAPLIIGLTVTATNLFGIPYTGVSINPARSLGPALISGRWQHHWIFWAGPIIGGCTAAILYQYVIAPMPSDEREKDAENACDSELHSTRPLHQCRKNSVFSLGDLRSIDTEISSPVYINKSSSPSMPAMPATNATFIPNPISIEPPEITVTEPSKSTSNSKI